MKNLLRTVPLVSIITALSVTGAPAEAFRTDINPALRYYQAFLMTPTLAEADDRHFYEKDWRGLELDAQAGRLAESFDNAFQALREAVPATVPCDWGIDLSHGPETILPGLVYAKKLSQAARLRAMWRLQNGKPMSAANDLIAVATLARRLSQDRILISALVQIAMENIIASVVAENFYRWDDDALGRLQVGLAALPDRGTVVGTIDTEIRGFYDWQLARIQEIGDKHGRDEAAAMEELRTFFTRLSSEGNDRLANEIIEAGGRRVAGIVRLLDEVRPLYREVEAILRLPLDDYAREMEAFMSRVREHDNPMVRDLFPVFDRCRAKEIAIEVKLALLRAGIAYKLGGEEALTTVKDPAGQGPFTMRRVVWKGEDRGFALSSEYAGRGYPEVLVFIEKPGVPLHVDGEKAGQAIERE